MNCRQAAHVVAPSFLGFRMIRLMAESDPPGDVFIVVLSCFGWLINGVMMFDMD